MRTHKFLGGLVIFLLCLGSTPVYAKCEGEAFTVAAASSLRYALEDIAAAYRHQQSADCFEIIYGSSGKLSSQILNGAPYDVFLSADTEFPEQLQAAGYTAGKPVIYAIGRIVLWSSNLDAKELDLATLGADPRIRRLAIAQPLHAPYGMRAREAMQASGSWDSVQSKLVFGENISQVAQMAASGAADAAIISLALARSEALLPHPYQLIDTALHAELAQAGVVTRRARDNAAAASFLGHISTEAAQAVLQRYGFEVPLSGQE